MSNYKVNYEIEVDAPDALSAALQVEEIFKNPSYRPYLEVIDTKTGKIENIDLEEFSPINL